jgi:hypothetical protein
MGDDDTESTARAVALYNDIEFSGERKRVRCNEGLGGTSRPRRFAGT